MKLNELFESSGVTGDVLSIAAEFLAAKGIKDKSAVNAILTMAKWPTAEADRIKREISGKPIRLADKLLTAKELFQLVVDLRKTISAASSNAPVLAGTRHIEAVTDEKLAKMQDFVKTHNAANKKDRLKLSVYDRKDGKKVWVDGSVEAIAAFKKATS